MTKVLFMTAAALICLTPPVFADPVLITSGTVSLGGFLGPFPPFGVTLLGSDTELSGVTFANAIGFVRLGQTVSLNRSLNFSSSLSGPFEQTVNGREFTDVVLRGTLNFRSEPFVISSSGRFTTPFTMSGTVSIFESLPFHEAGALLLTAQLEGTGTAGTALAKDFGDGSFATGGVSYSFAAAPAAATPEPATLLLVGSGGLIAVRRSRRRGWR